MATPNFTDALKIITGFQTQLRGSGVNATSIEEFKNFASAFSNLANFDAAAVAENLTAFSAIQPASWANLSNALTKLSPILVNLGSNPQVKEGATTLSVLSSALVGFTEINFSKLTTSIGKLLLFNRLLSLPGVLKAVTGAFKNLGGMISGLGKGKDVAKGAEVLGNIAAGLNALQNISFGKLLRSILTILTLMPLLRNLFKKLAVLMDDLKDSRLGARVLDLITKSFTALGEVKWIKVLLGTFALDRLKKSLENIIPTFELLGRNADSINKGLIVLGAVGDEVSKWGSFKIFFGVINMTLASIALGLIAVAGTLLGLASPLISIGAVALNALGVAIKAFGVLAADPYFWLGILALGALAVIALILGDALLAAGDGAELLADSLPLLIIPLLELGLMSGLIILAAAALVVLGLAIVAFAAVMLIFSPAIIISIDLLHLLAAAVSILGLAFKDAGEGVSASLVPFIELSGSADKLMKAARAITAIGYAIAGFRMAIGNSGIFSRILNFFGFGDSNDTIKLIKDLADLSSSLDKTAAALERILFAADAIDSMNLKNKNAQKIKDGVKATADGLETSSSARGKMSTGNSATVNNTVINNASSNPSTVVNNFAVNHGERTNGLFGFAMVGTT